MRRLLLLFASIVLASLVVASVPLFILYDDDRVAKADAVMVLAGEKRRLVTALELVEQGVASVLVISDGLDPRWTRANRLCRFGDPERIVCVRPEPYSTRGEARLAARAGRATRLGLARRGQLTLSSLPSANALRAVLRRPPRFRRLPESASAPAACDRPGVGKAGRGERGEAVLI